jgi:hypothetical protein
VVKKTVAERVAAIVAEAEGLRLDQRCSACHFPDRRTYAFVLETVDARLDPKATIPERACRSCRREVDASGETLWSTGSDGSLVPAHVVELRFEHRRSGESLTPLRGAPRLEATGGTRFEGPATSATAAADRALKLRSIEAEAQVETLRKLEGIPDTQREALYPFVYRGVLEEFRKREGLA